MNGSSPCSNFSTNHGETCTINCDTGFHLNGPATATCGNGRGVNGEWDDDTQSCEREFYIFLIQLSR